jgi:hypothetical protein
MAVKQVQYRGLTVKAAAFEVMGLGRFIVLVSVSRTQTRSIDRKEKFFEPPSADGFFDDRYEELGARLPTPERSRRRHSG